MKSNNNIINLSRIKTCAICVGHFKPLYKSHELCPACYYGTRQAQAIAVAVKCQRLSHDIK